MHSRWNAPHTGFVVTMRVSACLRGSVGGGLRGSNPLAPTTPCGIVEPNSTSRVPVPVAVSARARRSRLARPDDRREVHLPLVKCPLHVSSCKRRVRWWSLTPRELRSILGSSASSESSRMQSWTTPMRGHRRSRVAAGVPSPLGEKAGDRAIQVLVVAGDSPVLLTRSNGRVATWPDVLEREPDVSAWR
jgi:hypothetical protein